MLPRSRRRENIRAWDREVIEGYSLRECDRIMWNDVAHTVTWRGSSDVSSLSGRPVRLKIVMRSAKLYAFQFATD